MERDALKEYLHVYLNVSQFKDYCPNGMQVEGKEKIHKIATAVSGDLVTIEHAVEKEVDALIVHHGIFWKNDPYPVTGSKKRKIELLLKHKISLFAYHLPLDAHQEVGNNWKAAKDLGWNDLEPFGTFNGIEIGVRGAFSSCSVDVFIAKIEKYYGRQAVKALGGPSQIQTAALISGGAYKELASAASAGIDCFITGNFDEPAWGVALEEKIHFLALGHTFTEKIGPKALADHLSQYLGIDAQFLDTENPF